MFKHWNSLARSLGKKYTHRMTNTLQKVCNYRARAHRRLAKQEQANADANFRYYPSVGTLFAWKIGPAKFQCCIIYFLDLV